jgi:glycosyltransferase involved in cell wall biosynthesis
VKKRIIVSVTNDLSTDQRVRKQCASLHEAGFEVMLIGRRQRGSLPVIRPYKLKRLRLFFNRKALFYAEYNFRLFFILLFSRAHLYYANDLDTLTANALASFIRRKPLVYDSHEYFTEVPEIQSRPLVKSVWKFLERAFIGRASIVLTVNESIATLLRDTYNLAKVHVVRNVPENTAVIVRKSREELRLPGGTRLLILQGSGINVDRGAEELLQAMAFMPNVLLMIVGSGDAVPMLKSMCEHGPLVRKVQFFPKMPYADMMAYTAIADLALSLDKDNNLNYRFSLPNKLFDYIAANVPVLVSDLVELRRIVEGSDIGRISKSHDPVLLAAEISSMLDDQDALMRYRANAKILSGSLNWNKEFEPVMKEIELLIS